MIDKWSFANQIGSTGIIAEPDLRVFIEQMAREFEEMRITAMFDDGVSCHARDIRQIISQIDRNDRRVKRLIVEGYSRAPNESAEHGLRGQFHLELGESYRSAGSISFSYEGDRFFKIRDDVQQYLKGLQPWYASLYGLRGSHALLVETVVGAALVLLVLRAGAGMALLFSTKEAVNAWIDVAVRQNVSIILPLVLLAGWAAIAHLKKLFIFIYPPIILALGSEKKRQEQIREVRKWTLTSTGSVMMGLLWLALK